MICTFTARRLKPGRYEAFRSAWDPGTGAVPPPGWSRVYQCRDLADPDVVVSFGFFDGTAEELRVAQERMHRQSQLDRVQPHVEEILLDGSYEVVEELSG
jgi:hypothetical protein